MNNKNPILIKNLALLQQVANEVSSQQKQTYKKEGCLLSMLVKDSSICPRELAAMYYQKYGYYIDDKKLTGDSVIRVFRKLRISNIQERTKLIEKANETAQLLIEMLGCGRTENIAEHLLAVNHRQYKRIIVLALLNHGGALFSEDCRADLIRLNSSFAAELIDTLVDRIEASFDPTVSVELENERLKKDIQRKKELLDHLQDSFYVQLEESRLEVQADMISLLNSPKYGCILDMLVSAKRGFDNLREKGMAVPVELRSLRTLVRKLQEFVEDFGVSEIMQVGTKMTISAADTERLQYNGTPFSDDNEIKDVVVVSPGWQIQERNITLSYPRVQEK